MADWPFPYVTEDEVRGMLSMPQAIELVARALRDRAEGQAVDVPRERTRTPKGHLHIMQGASLAQNMVGLKAYYRRPGGSTFLVLLIDHESGAPKGIVEAQWLGALRTGAASGVATRSLALPEAATVACIGASLQAETQLQAVCAVRPIREALVFSRDPRRAEAFCARLSATLAIAMRPAGIEEAVAAAEVINICTRADQPVLPGAMLRPGQHVNAAGVNALARREIDLEAVKRADRIVVDSVAVAMRESGDLLPAVEAGLLQWDRLTELGDVLAGLRPGRTTATEITLFESHGMAIEDLYCGQWVLDAALRRAAFCVGV